MTRLLDMWRFTKINISLYLKISVTRFGEITLLWQIFKNLLALYLRLIWFWAKF